MTGENRSKRADKQTTGKFTTKEGPKPRTEPPRPSSPLDSCRSNALERVQCNSINITMFKPLRSNRNGAPPCAVTLPSIQNKSRRKLEPIQQQEKWKSTRGSKPPPFANKKKKRHKRQDDYSIYFAKEKGKGKKY
ncbi:hypothetical protein PVK06_025869 [Gossypium arboreum]|uniref:Uncharacterized protein n=1 Tax=Gossypium arboreum TaxID=29729 RepID=A0ABR0NW21_GOSAR|nr:hypothetical protein PVK06_025869 [Gossypium arboreum]